MRKTRLPLILLSLALLAPGTALAQGGAGDQYTEQPPSAGGGGGSGQTGGSDGADGAGGDTGATGSATTSASDPPSSDRERAAELARQTAPDSDPLRRAKAASKDGSSFAPDDIVDRIDPETLGASGSTASEGAGVALPIVLGATLLAAIGFALWRRRSRSEPFA